jgi:hypothetical protein
MTAISVGPAGTTRVFNLTDETAVELPQDPSASDFGTRGAIGDIKDWL